MRADRFAVARRRLVLTQGDGPTSFGNLHVVGNDFGGLRMRAIGTVAGVQIQRTIQTASTMSDRLFVYRVPSFRARRVSPRGFGQILLEYMKDRVEEISDARLTAQPWTRIVCNRVVLRSRSFACRTANLFVRSFGSSRRRQKQQKYARSIFHLLLSLSLSLIDCRLLDTYSLSKCVETFRFYFLLFKFSLRNLKRIYYQYKQRCRSQSLSFILCG